MTALRRLAPFGTLLVGMLMMLGTFMMVDAALVQAKELPGVLRRFGSFADATGIAVDEESGDSLVLDSQGSEVVYVFGPEGEGPLTELTGSPTEHFSFAGEPAGVAVDNDPTSASYRDVYVTDVRHNLIDKFKRTGSGEYEYLCQIDGWNGKEAEACTVSGGSTEQPFVEPVGVAVDSQGNVYISSYGPEAGFVAEFDSAGNGVMQLNSSQHELLGGHPEGLAIDSAGDLFVQNFIEVPVLHAERIVVKFSFSSPGVVTSEEAFAGPATAIAIDPTADDLYVEEQSTLHVFTPSKEELPALFGSISLGASRGVALRDTPTVPEISVSNQSVAETFGLIKLPDVTQCQASGVTATTAKLEGTVDPLSTPGAVYRFEYTRREPHEEFNTAFTEVEGSGFGPASDEVTELVPGTLYSCRLEATDTAGEASSFLLNEGREGTFETPPNPPTIVKAETSNITTNSVIFHGEVGPGNGGTTYHFEYGKTSSYGTSLPDVGIGSGFEAVPVEQLSGAALEPSSEYHYALVAENRSKRVVGEDHTFVTLPAATAPRPPAARIGPAVAITPTSATLTGTVDPGGQTVSYSFRFGTTTAYGTQISAGISAGAGEESVTLPLQGLPPGTTFHYQLVVTGPGGSAESEDAVFTTPSIPPALTAPAAPSLIYTPPFPSFTEKHLPPVKKCKCPKHKKSCKKCPVHKPKKKARKRRG